jgi:hypothetical protein
MLGILILAARLAPGGQTSAPLNKSLLQDAGEAIATGDLGEQKGTSNFYFVLPVKTTMHSIFLELSALSSSEMPKQKRYFNAS